MLNERLELSETNVQRTPGEPATVAPSLLEQEIPLQPEVLRRAEQSFAGPVRDLLDALADRGVDDWVVTGCGDSFSAGYLYALSLGWPPRRACGLGVACASMVAGTLGSDGVRGLDAALALAEPTG